MDQVNAIPAEQQNKSDRKPDLLDAATKMGEMFGEDAAYIEEEDAWVRWNGKYWADLTKSKTQLDDMATDALTAVGVSISNEGKLNGTIRLAKSKMRRELKTKPHLVNFNNGTLEIVRTKGEDSSIRWKIGELHPHNRKDGMRNCLPYDYTPDGDWSSIRDFYEGAVPDPLGRECHFTHVGLSLIGDTSMHMVEIAHGPTRSGKGTSMRLTRLACGSSFEDSEQWTPKEIFDDGAEGMRSRYTYRNGMMVCVDEVPAKILAADEVFKIISAHGGASMRAIGRDYELKAAWKPKMSLSTNSMLAIKDPSGATQARICPINFPNGRAEDRRDGNLTEKLMTEIPGYAAMCIQEALKTLNRGYYRRSVAMMAYLDLWAMLGNALRRFIKDQCVVGDSGTHRIPTAIIYGKYTAYVTSGNGQALSKANFVGELVTMGLGISEGNGRAKYWENNAEKTINTTILFGIVPRSNMKNAPEVQEQDEGVFTDYSPYVMTDEDRLAKGEALVKSGKLRQAFDVIKDAPDTGERTRLLLEIKQAFHETNPEQPNQLQMAA